MNDNTPGACGPSPSEVGGWLQELLRIMTIDSQVDIVQPSRKCLRCDGTKVTLDGSMCFVCRGTGSPDIEPSLPIEPWDFNDSD